MAKAIGIHRNTYGRAERGETENAFIYNFQPLFSHEECLILRRRSDLTQKDCADLMGITRYWFNMMENGHVACNSLEDFWNER